jgi:hypothetical protein
VKEGVFEGNGGGSVGGCDNAIYFCGVGDSEAGFEFGRRGVVGAEVGAVWEFLKSVVIGEVIVGEGRVECVWVGRGIRVLFE